MNKDGIDDVIPLLTLLSKDPNSEKEHPLIERLSLKQKGADTIVLQPGSHTFKFGFACQIEPFTVPTVVAKPRRSGGNFSEYRTWLWERHMQDDETRQKAFDKRYSAIEGALAEDLRKAGYMTLDESGKKTTSGAKVQFKIFDSENYLLTKKERH